MNALEKDSPTNYREYKADPTVGDNTTPHELYADIEPATPGIWRWLFIGAGLLLGALVFFVA